MVKHKLKLTMHSSFFYIFSSTIKHGKWTTMKQAWNVQRKVCTSIL